MGSIEKLNRLMTITLNHLPIGSEEKDIVLSLCSQIEEDFKKQEQIQEQLNKQLKSKNMPQPKTWVTIKDAVAYYGVATHTVYTWRRNGRLKSRPAPNGNRIGYEYYLDPHLKEEIEIARKKDKRWL